MADVSSDSFLYCKIMDESRNRQTVPALDSDARAQAASELEKRQVVREVWVQAVKEVGNAPAEANTRYIELRTAQLQQTHIASSALPFEQILLDQSSPSAPAPPPERPVDPSYVLNRKNDASLPFLPAFWRVKRVLALLAALAVIAVIQLWPTRSSDGNRLQQPLSSSSETDSTLQSSLPMMSSSTTSSTRGETYLPPPLPGESRRGVPVPAALLSSRPNPVLTRTAEEVIEQYPYFALPGDNPWLDNLIVWRDAYIQILGLSPPQALWRAANVVERYRVKGYGRCLPDRRSTQSLAVDSASSCQHLP